MERIFISSSLVEGDLSFWSNDLPKNDFQDGASLDTTIQLMDALVSSKQDQKSFDITAGGDQDNPLPDWMSEKMDVGNWPDILGVDSPNQIDELEIDNMSPTHELLSLSPLSDASDISDFFLPEDYLDEELLASSPGSSIGSSGTTVNNSAYTTTPSSPSSVGSDDAEFDSFQETDQNMGDALTLESLLNPCSKDAVFLQLTGTLPLDLHIPSEGDILSLQENVNKMQVELQGKVKSESKVSRRSSKSKGVSKERKERKKGQNKEAATRYRQKKKKESQGLGGDLDQLEKINGDLQGKVSSLEQEIRYLKNLLQEIYKVKGQIQILQSP